MIRYLRHPSRYVFMGLVAALISSAAAAQDVDYDTIPDAEDNCVSMPNADQSDVDADGVGDACDNCLEVPNGPLLNWGVCDDQQDADGDGYGNACDSDVNNDGATGLDDWNVIYSASVAVSADPLYDLDCDGAASLEDVGQAWDDAVAAGPVGPSGYDCAGTAPCPPGVIGSPLVGELTEMEALSETAVSGTASACEFTTWTSPTMCEQTVLVYPLGQSPADGSPLAEVAVGEDGTWVASGLGGQTVYGFFLRNHAPSGEAPTTATSTVRHQATDGPAAPVLPAAPVEPAGPLAGTTQAHFEVTGAGAAIYEVPIVVSPGTRGLQPDLSLVYSSSNRRNGLLGVHWELSGFTAITRCGQRWTPDGRLSGVTQTEEDRFCLDGQRLVPVDGDYGAYGADGTEYRTEVDSFRRIVSHLEPAGGTGPLWFEVWTPDGRRMELGNSSDSALEVAGSSTISRWAVNRVVDTTGNYLEVSYFEDVALGEQRPTTIRYTGNVSAGLQPYASVQFDYEARTDQPILYKGGTPTRRVERLSEVRSLVGTEVVRRYRLSYGDELQSLTGRSRLHSIEECGSADGAESCLEPLVFDWLDPVANQYAIGGDLLDDDYNQYVPRAGDFDGDGFDDVLWYKAKSDDLGIVYGAREKVRFWYGRPDGTFDVVSYTQAELPAGDIPVLGDFNGDGRTDVYWQYLAFHQDGSYSAIVPYELGTVDQAGRSFFGAGRVWFSDDGRSWLEQDLSLGMERYGLVNLTIPVAGDFNGDGISDLFWFAADDKGRTDSSNPYREIWYGWNESSSVLPPGQLTPDGLWRIAGNTAGEDGNLGQYRPTLGDFDADGMTDILWWRAREDGRAGDENKRVLWYAHSDGSFAIVNNVAGQDGHLNESLPLAGDFNGDGATDVLWFRADNKSRTGKDAPEGLRWLWISRAAEDGAFDVVYDVAGQNGNYLKYVGRVLDANADGLDDVLWYSADEERRTSHDGSERRDLWLSHGDGTFSIVANLAGMDGQEERMLPLVADFTGDELDDLVWFRAATAGTAENTPGATMWKFDDMFPDLMTGIENGLGERIEIAYLPLGHSDMYVKFSEALGGPIQPWTSPGYPLRDVPSTQCLVSAVIRSDGDGGSYSFVYSYAGGRLDVLRRLFLGFAGVSMEDSRDGSTISRAFRQDYPFHGHEEASSGTHGGRHGRSGDRAAVGGDDVRGWHALLPVHRDPRRDRVRARRCPDARHDE